MILDFPLPSFPATRWRLVEEGLRVKSRCCLRPLATRKSALVNRVSVDEMDRARHASASHHYSGQDLHGSFAP